MEQNKEPPEIVLHSLCELLRSMIRHTITSTFTILVEYLSNPNPRKLKEVKYLLESNLMLTEKIRDMYSKISFEILDTDVIIISRMIIGLFYEMFQELETDPEKLYDPEFKREYLDKLNTMIKVCEGARKICGSPFRFYKALLISLAVLVKRAKPRTA